jgi:hypothetical protein
LCAARAGQILNLSGLGADAGVSHNTARSWLSVLEASFIAFRLPPLHRNIGKRLVKSPKLCFYDTGLLCFLLGIRRAEELELHPLRGPIFENWVISEILKARLHRGRTADLHFYRDHSGLEIDLVIERALEPVAVEIKSGRTIVPEFAAPFGAFERALRRDPLVPPSGIRRVIVHGGDERQERDGVSVLPWHGLDEMDWS